MKNSQVQIFEKHKRLCLVLSKNNLKIVFDQIIKSATEYLVRVKSEKKTEKLFATMVGKTKTELNELHQQLGHPKHSYTLKTAKIYDWEIHRKLKICEG